MNKQKKVEGFSEKEFKKLEDDYQEIRGDIDVFNRKIEEFEQFIELINEHKSDESCPICAKKSPNWKERISDLQKEIKKWEVERDQKTIESEEIEKEHDEWTHIPEIKNDLKNLIVHKNGTEKKLGELTENKNKKEREQLAILKKIESFKIKIDSSYSLLKGKNEELKKQRSEILSELKSLKKAKDLREEKEKELEEIHIKIVELQKQYEIELHKSRKQFNKEIADVLGRLNFKDFRRVEILNDFSLAIDRAEIKNQPLTTLSGSERLTIGLMLLISAHKAYIKKLPFFLADETTLSYDQTRFERFAIYLKRNVPYTIITALAPEGEKLKVEMVK